ncbi:phosphoribosyltransferase family protein [Streptomyces sp. NPDC001922]|uniref:phosphoribosyltransferase family protein n=1 Tax=Streptomyces sp. NPDC001922 TaxID=3364624 RepID=UPI0036846018
MRFADRAEAGRRLAGQLDHLRTEHPVVLGLPRGGVPVASEVARALDAPLDVILVRKLGVPYHRELGFGAIGEGGVRVVHDSIIRMSRVDEADLAEVQRTEEAELQRQALRFRGGRPQIPLAGRTAIVVDDGIATGATASAACRVARAHGAARVVLAVPVAPPDAAVALRSEVDELVCLSTPSAFYAVGEWYQDFAQTPDRDVVDLLARAAPDTGAGTGADTGPDPPGGASREAAPGGTAPDRAPDTTGSAATAPDPVPGAPRTAGAPATPSGAEPAATRREIGVDTDGVRLTGDLTVPEGARGLVAFAHGSGSSRRSPRNRSVAAALNDAGLGTLLFDLLTPEEELDRANVFDIETLSRRLLGAVALLRRRYGGVPVGCFGASTGAAAALRAAARRDCGIAAVVSRGGRPDLAGPGLADVTAPTLLVVGGRDTTVLDLNRQAGTRLTCEHRLAVVPRATHLFEEPGALDAVSDLARDWFLEHLAGVRPETPAGAARPASTRRHPEAHPGN